MELHIFKNFLLFKSVLVRKSVINDTLNKQKPKLVFVLFFFYIKYQGFQNVWRIFSGAHTYSKDV